MSGETEAKTSKLLTSLLTYVETGDKLMEKHEALFCCWAGAGGGQLFITYLFICFCWHDLDSLDSLSSDAK